MRTRTKMIVMVAMVSLVGLALAPAAAAADTVTSLQEEETAEEACEADIEDFDVHTSDDTITGPSDPGRVGVSAVTSITNECPVVVQVTFDIPNNMYYQGTSADASGQGLQTEVFEVPPGDTASFTSELFANQEGQHTVTADVEYFPEGQPGDARSLDNFMLTFNVVETGFPDDTETDDPEPAIESNGESDDTTSNGDDNGDILDFVGDHLEALGLISALLIAVLGLVYREPVVQLIMGNE